MRSRPGLAGGFYEETTERDASTTTGEQKKPPADVYGWDWTATTHAGRDLIVNELVDALGADVLVPGKGIHGWSRSVQAFDSGGYALGAVYFGGGRDDVHVLSTSGAADSARRAVLAFDGEARTSRVDTRVDTLTPWDDLVSVCEDVAAVYGSRITEMSSRTRGVSEGRTLYVGAPSSAVRVRVYEKWLESPGEWVDGTNRVEVQLRPKSNAKQRVTAWGPAETFCASKTTQALAIALRQEFVPAASLHVSKPTPDLERTLQVMGQQYGPAVEKWLALSGGDVEKVLDHLLGRAVDSRLDLSPVVDAPVRILAASNGLRDPVMRERDDRIAAADPWLDGPAPESSGGARPGACGVCGERLASSIAAGGVHMLCGVDEPGSGVTYLD